METEVDAMSRSPTQSRVVKKENPDWEAAEVKLETELILSDCEDEACSQEAFELKPSWDRFDNMLTEIMVLGKISKVVLERCDAGKGKTPGKLLPPKPVKGNITTLVSGINLKRHDGGENSQVKTRQLSPANIKVETFNAEAGDSITVVKNDPETLNSLIQVNAAVDIKKEEEEKGRIVCELVGHIPRSSAVDDYKKPLLRIVKCEERTVRVERELQQHSDVSSIVEGTNAVGGKTSSVTLQPEQSSASKVKSENYSDVLPVRIKVENEFELEETVGSETHSSLLDDAIETEIGNRPMDYIKVEESPIVMNELVTHLPACLKKEETSKEPPPEKPVRCDKKMDDANCELTADIEDSSVLSRNDINKGEIFSAGPELKRKVSSKIRKNNCQEKPLSCSECLYRCRYQSELKRHLRLHTRERPFQCGECSEKFKTKSNLNAHMSTHVSEKLFKCFHCAATFKSKGCLAKHLQWHSEERLFSSTVCSVKFKTKAELKSHLLIHSLEKRFECAQCGARFKRKSEIRPHLITHSDVKLYSCSNCPSKFRWSAALRCHLITKHSSGLRLYTCVHCLTKFKQKRQLVCHMVTHSNEKPYLSSQCPWKFKRKEELKSHLRHHTGEKPYSCSQCSANFSQKSTLKAHLVTHSDDKHFDCDLCPGKFKRHADVNKHKQIHVTERLFCCSHCPKKFKAQRILTMHIKVVHTGIEKRHACNQCTYRTYNLSDLKKHLLVHGNEKSFACDKCNANFKTSGHLKRHGSVHTNKRPFGCEKCPAKFKFKNNLILHLKRHTSNKSSYYTCLHCLCKFSRKAHLSRHIKIHLNEKS